MSIKYSLVISYSSPMAPLKTKSIAAFTSPEKYPEHLKLIKSTLILNNIWKQQL